jgi:hypothetical protein
MTPTQGEHAQTELAHELFAAAQLAPGEGIEDAVSRIAAALTAAAAQPAAPQGVADWTQPTTVAQRLGDAVQMLCGGKRPPDAMVTGWLDNTSEELQSFAASNGPAWAQGIGLIDAAMVMVDQPTEITTIDHPGRDHALRASNGQAPAAGAVAGKIELSEVARILKEGDGVWRPCTGCHELNEGHDTGAYSKVFGCALGNGCSECGGLGVIWDATDYEAMAEAMMEAEAPTPAAQADSVLEDAAQESEYRRGYRHGYEQRDAEVRGALA